MNKTYYYIIVNPTDGKHIGFIKTKKWLQQLIPPSLLYSMGIYEATEHDIVYITQGISNIAPIIKQMMKEKLGL